MRNYSQRIFISALMLLPACTRGSADSVPQWEIDYRNDPANFGIEGVLRYDEIASTTAIETQVPWTDTYWPLVSVCLKMHQNFVV